MAAEVRGTSVEPLFEKARPTTDFTGCVQVLTLPADADLPSVLQKLEQLSEVEYAEPDVQFDLFESPNDPLYIKQWALHNTGQMYWHVMRNPGSSDDELSTDSGYAGADINADAILSNPPDGTSVVVAIIDTGIDFDHPDLTGMIWVNPNEIDGNGIDDDHNGYVDDQHGWDFSANDSTLIPIAEDNDPQDRYGHGTHVAGIVAATSGNGIGIAGVAPPCRIMTLKIHPMMLASMAARAIVYAADNGADVINMSWGSNFPTKLIEDALDYASKKGVILCAASGNSGNQSDSYPAALTSVISVGATDSRDHVTSFSTFGPALDVVAPGESILSLRAAFTDMYGRPPSFEPDVHIIENDYYEASGTSMACPFVAAIAGYLRSVSPGILPTTAQDIIQQSARDLIDPYGDGRYCPGRDNYSGYGRVDLQHALSLAPAVSARILSPTANQVLSGAVNIRGIADGAEFNGYTMEYGEGDEPSVWHEIVSSSHPVTGGTLATWDTDNLAGIFTLRLQVGETNVSQVSIRITNRDYVEILHPLENDTISNATVITGSALTPDFQLATLEYSDDSSTSAWTVIDTLLQPVFRSRMREWNTSALTDGLYKIRLTVQTSRGALQRSVRIRVLSPFSGSDGWRVSVEGVPTIVPTYGDFDGDGHNEILVGTSAGIKFFSTDGSPKTSGMPEIPECDFRTPIAVGDLNNDGIDDFVAASDDPPQLYIVRSGSRWKSVMLPVMPQSAYFDYNDESKFPILFLEDINGDGIDEIHYQSSGSILSRTYIILQADGKPWEGQSSYTHVERCLPADLDNDGVDEIYCLSDSLREYDFSGNKQNAVGLNLASQFEPEGMSAADVDDDGRHELMLFGRYPWSINLQNYWMFAFADNLMLEESWPREIRISRELKPNMPVFGDLDGDSSIEYATSCYDLDFGSVYVWRNDGQAYYGDSTASGFFASVPEPSMLNMPLLAALDPSNGQEIVSCALPDAWGTSDRQSIVAWNSSSQLLTGWPLVVAVSPAATNDYANTPVIGDINQDGNVDLMMTTMIGDLVFLNLPGHPWQPDASSCPIWRYNRRFNNIAPPSPGKPLDVSQNDEANPLPREFTLHQNFPNPFNSSTLICFALQKPTSVKLDILNVLGQTLRSFDLGIRLSGEHQVEWDGRNDMGNEVASGVYFYRLICGRKVVVRKMVLLK